MYGAHSSGLVGSVLAEGADGVVEGFGGPVGVWSAALVECGVDGVGDARGG